jgi:hypothetical protein
MLASRGTTSDPETAQACTGLLAQTLRLLERAEELLDADRARLFSALTMGEPVESDLYRKPYLFLFATCS